MKPFTILHLAISLLTIAFFSLASHSLAQDGDYPEPADKFAREELAQMLAPIALYPDVLLSHILMASTYPIEVIEADRWIKANPQLTGTDLDTALLDKDWDPSVKALCHFPTVLNLMSERIAETTNIGNAFLVQEVEVMDMIQELRAQAHAQGNLVTSAEQKVIVEKKIIIIEPPDPQIIYVPYYDPLHVYGTWWYPNYPPYYWVPRGVILGRRIAYWPRFYFDFTFVHWSFFDWHRRHIFIHVHKRPKFVRHDRWRDKPGPWFHEPRHRRGVAYRDKHTARKYGKYPYPSRDFPRATRGFPEDFDRDGRQPPRRTQPPDDRSGPGRDQMERAERDRRERGRVEQERQQRERGDRERQMRDRSEQDRQQERVERDRRERGRVEQERQQRDRADRERQMRDRTEQDRQQERAERDRRERGRVEQERQQRDRADQERQMRDRTERDRQQQERAERDRRERTRVEQERQQRGRSERDRQGQQRIDRERRERDRDNVFNRVDDPGKERQSSKRGRSSRQGRDDDSRGRDKTKRDDRSGRDTRGEKNR